MYRIISKRRGERRSKERFFNPSSCTEYSGGFHIPTRTIVFPHEIQQLQVILHTELILLQEFSKKYYNYKAHPVLSRADQYKASSSECSPCLQAFYTAESSHKAPYSIPGPYSISRLPVILPGRNSILSSSQHPGTPYSTFQANFTGIHLVLQKILPGETGFFSKGLSIVCPYNTKVSVFQFTCYKKFNSIQSSSNSMRRYSTLSSIQVVLVAILHKIH